MSRSTSKQTSLSIVRVLIGVAALAVIGASGWFVYQQDRTQLSGATGNTNKITDYRTTTTPSTAPAVTYLEIKEWGIKLPLPKAASDAYYVVPAGISTNADGKPSSILLGLRSTDSSCGTVTPAEKDFNNALGAISRNLPADHDPVTGELYTTLYPNGAIIDGYYYGYTNALGKNKGCVSKATFQVVDSSLAAGAKGAMRGNTSTN
jgi:hypothetical protein